MAVDQNGYGAAAFLANDPWFIAVDDAKDQVVWSAVTCAPLAALRVPGVDALSWDPAGRPVARLGRTLHRSHFDLHSFVRAHSGEVVTVPIADLRLDVSALDIPPVRTGVYASPRGGWEADVVAKTLQRTAAHPLGPSDPMAADTGFPRFSENDRLLVSGGPRPTVWTLDGPVPRVVPVGDCLFAAPSPDGRTVACIDGRAGFVVFHDVATGKIVLGPYARNGVDLRWASRQLVLSNPHEATFVCIDGDTGATTGTGVGASFAVTRRVGPHFVRAWRDRRPVREMQGSAFAMSEHGVVAIDDLAVVETKDVLLATMPTAAVASLPGTWIELGLQSVSSSGHYALLTSGEVVDVRDLGDGGELERVGSIGAFRSAQWIGGDALVFERDHRRRGLWDARAPTRTRTFGGDAPFPEAVGLASGRWRFVAGTPARLFDGKRLLALPVDSRNPIQSGALDPSSRFLALGQAPEPSGEEDVGPPRVTSFYELNGAVPRRVARIAGGGVWIGPDKFLSLDGTWLSVFDLSSRRQKRLARTSAAWIKVGPSGYLGIGWDLWHLDEKAIVVPVGACGDRARSVGDVTLEERDRQLLCELTVAADSTRRSSPPSCVDAACRVVHVGVGTGSADELVRLGDPSRVLVYWLDIPGGRFAPLLATDEGRYEVEPSVAPLVWLHDGHRIFRADTRPSHGLVERLFAPLFAPR